MTMSIRQSSAISATAADIGLLSTCAFLGTIGASLTGFGQAIIFLFVWQIVELAGYNGDFKSAVFIQALSLFSMQPLVLYKAKVWKNAHRRVLLLFVPITLVSTPLGQLVSDGVPTNIVQVVAGVLVTFVACWELYSKRSWFLSLGPCNRRKDEKGGETETGADDSAQNTAERGEAGVEVEIEKAGVGDKNESTGKKETTSSSKSANNAPNDDVESPEDPNGKDVAATLPETTVSSVYASLAVEPDNTIDMSTAKTSTSPQTNNFKPDSVQEDEERLKFGINKPTLMTLLAGGKFIHTHSI